MTAGSGQPETIRRLRFGRPVCCQLHHAHICLKSAHQTFSPSAALLTGLTPRALWEKKTSSRFQGSNLGPSACKADALPAELNRDRSRQRGLNPHSPRWQRGAIANYAMPAYGRRKCLFLSPLLNFIVCFAYCRHKRKPHRNNCPFRIPVKWNLVESNHVLMLFRHALNDRTSSGSMMSGNRGARTHDLLVNSQALCQLSYVPEY